MAVNIRGHELDDCRPKVRKYMRKQQRAMEKGRLKQNSVDRYACDIRWIDLWMTENGIENFNDVGDADAEDAGEDLDIQYNGANARHRYDRISHFFDWMERRKNIDENPFAAHDPREDLFLGTKSEQSRRIESANDDDEDDEDEDETYAVKPEEIEMMCDATKRYRTRDQLIIRLIWQTGIRAGELAQVEIDRHIDFEKRAIDIADDIAKGGHGRVVPYKRSIDGLIHDWVNGGLRESMLAGRESKYLFVGERGASIGSKRINEIIRQAATDAGINRVLWTDASGHDRWKITSHSVRHGCATQFAKEAPEHIYSLSKQLGHSSTEITRRIYIAEDRWDGHEEMRRYAPD